jgi:hypothetical protein
MSSLIAVHCVQWNKKYSIVSGGHDSARRYLQHIEICRAVWISLRSERLYVSVPYALGEWGVECGSSCLASIWVRCPTLLVYLDTD